MTKKNKKGFTLTELIVVIAIIAILAAVLIPTSISFIKKAKKSNDGQLAAQMTKEINWYCLENDVNQDNLLGTDIRTILLFRGYDLVPKTDDWTFWYNQESKKVELIDNVDTGVSASDFNTYCTNPSDPTNIFDSYFLLGKGKSETEEMVNYLCTINNLSSLNSFNGKVSSLTNTKNQTFIDYFNPNNTLYITNSDGFTNGSTEHSITRIVASEKTINLPKVSIENIINKLSTSISNIPLIIKTQEDDSNLTTYFPSTKQVSNENVKKIILNDFTDFVEEESFFYRFQLGEYFDENGIQEIEDEILSIVKNSEGYTTTVRKFIVSYYNESGLYARAYTTYSITQK